MLNGQSHDHVLVRRIGVSIRDLNAGDRDSRVFIARSGGRHRVDRSVVHRRDVDGAGRARTVCYAVVHHPGYRAAGVGPEVRRIVSLVVEGHRAQRRLILRHSR